MVQPAPLFVVDDTDLDSRHLRGIALRSIRIRGFSGGASSHLVPGIYACPADSGITSPSTLAGAVRFGCCAGAGELIAGTFNRPLLNLQVGSSTRGWGRGFWGGACAHGIELVGLERWRR